MSSRRTSLKFQEGLARQTLGLCKNIALISLDKASSSPGSGERISLDTEEIAALCI